MKYALLSLMMTCASIVNAQVSHGGMPLSFEHAYKAPAGVIDIDTTGVGRFINQNSHDPSCIGLNIDTLYNYDANDGIWLQQNNGLFSYIVTFRLKGAKAVALYFNNIDMSDGAKLFAYNKTKTFVVGSYTKQNFGATGQFSFEPVEGEYITLEFNDLSSKYLQFAIGCFSYFFKDVFVAYSLKGSGFGSSGECEVNVNCEEGDDLRNQADAVLRILLLERGGWFYCTGTLVNNTMMDEKPYVLSACHCGEHSTAQDMTRWVYYFQYTSPQCANSDIEPEHKTLVGCQRIASAPYHDKTTNAYGSDFLLVLLDGDTIPTDYNPYFAGWNISENIPEEADCIHHPSGDVKKISHAYNFSRSNFANETSPIKTHWEVNWMETPSGHGVTEGGSSGSALFDSDNLIVGTLTGGNSSCDYTDLTDFFGMMSYSWNKNDTTPEKRLDIWLDPTNSGVTRLTGLASNIRLQNILITNDNGTRLSHPDVVVGNTLTLQPVFNTVPDSCKWTILEETPRTIITEKDKPAIVQCNNAGIFDLKITIYHTVDGNVYTKETNHQQYIKVRPNVFPNIVDDRIILTLGDAIERGNTDIRLYTLSGMLTHQFSDYTMLNENSVELDFSSLALTRGYYVLYVKVGNKADHFSVFKK